MFQAIKPLLIAGLLFAPAAGRADWQVQPESSIGYVSIKNSSFAENNRFSGISGTLAGDGALEIQIDLTSVETGVSIRNERMQNIFFEVAGFANAKVTAQLPADALEELSSGNPVRLTVPLTLSLHGVGKTVSAPLLAVPHGDQVLVTSTTPVLLSAADFGLDAGVTALQKIAGLSAISRAVPVTVDLVLAAD